MEACLWYLHLLLDYTFRLCFEHELAPGENWTVPLCGREMGEKRMYPHIHLVYVQKYGAQESNLAFYLMTGEH